MQKRKVKLNILDIAIFAVIICSVLVLIFRDTIGEFFGKPEIAALEVHVTSVSADNNVNDLFAVGSTVTFTPQRGGKQVQAVVTSATKSFDGKAEFTLSCNGYQRLGRFYTENGEQLSQGGECSLSFGASTLDCRLQTAGIQ